MPGPKKRIAPISEPRAGNAPNQVADAPPRPAAVYRRHIHKLESAARRQQLGVLLSRADNWVPPGTMEPCFESRADDPEHCIWCGKHVSQHFGATEYRCYSRT